MREISQQSKEYVVKVVYGNGIKVLIVFTDYGLMSEWLALQENVDIVSIADKATDDNQGDRP